MITIVLADDQYLIRKNLKLLFSFEPDFKVVGEVENGLEAINLVEKIKPDVLLLDMMMPGMNGLEVTRSLNGRGIKTKIVILSMQDCYAYVSQVLSFGAKGYVLKDAPPEELITAIREVKAGRNYLCSILSDRISITNAYTKQPDQPEMTSLY